jgi:hypothetical protein
MLWRVYYALSYYAYIMMTCNVLRLSVHSHAYSGLVIATFWVLVGTSDTARVSPLLYVAMTAVLTVQPRPQSVSGSYISYIFSARPE